VQLYLCSPSFFSCIPLNTDEPIFILKHWIDFLFLPVGWENVNNAIEKSTKWYCALDSYLNEEPWIISSTLYNPPTHTVVFLTVTPLHNYERKTQLRENNKADDPICCVCRQPSVLCTEYRQWRNSLLRVFKREATESSYFSSLISNRMVRGEGKRGYVLRVPQKFRATLIKNHYAVQK